MEAQKWRRKSGDTKVEAQKWRRKSGDTKVEAQKWRRKSGDTKVEAQKWGRKSGGAKVEAQKWRHKSGSAKVAAQKWRRKCSRRNCWKKKCGSSFQATAFFNSIGEMHLIFLLILPILWPSIECNEQKVPKHSGKKQNHVNKMTKDLGKMPAQIADGKNYFLLEKDWQKILGKNSKYNEQLQKVVKGINKNQCLLEAVFAKNSKNKYFPNENFTADEFKFFKNQRSEIFQNDPALSQLLEGLFAVALSTNNAIKNDGANELSAHMEKLKQSLAYAVIFMAKRGKIRLQIPRGETENEPKAILIELFDIYNDLQMDIEKSIKSWQKRDEKEGREHGQKGRGKYGQKGNEEKQEKERRFLQFVARSLEIEWDANAFCIGGQNGNDDDDDTNRRRRRGKRRNAPPPPGYYNWDQQETNNPRTIAKILLIIVVMTVFTLVVNHFCTNRSGNNQSQRGTEMDNYGENLSPHITTIESSKQLVTAYKAIPLETFVENGDEQNDECSICLGEIKPGTMVRPLPCKHIFDDACIEKWFMGGNITCPLCREKLQISPTAQTMTMANHLGVMAPPGGIVAPRVQVCGGTNEGHDRHGTVTGDQHEVVIDISMTANQNGGNIGGTENHGPATLQHQATENTGGTENQGTATLGHEATETRLNNGSENETK
ncbi:hypothetical protein niasHT_018239 [Heterodera trifolii]|uniref:RING-type domain-containing protein n=1 Tax=Heterodera trifolii TaxID=157864 RepID=A0ABD2L7H8_9BILA